MPAGLVFHERHALALHGVGDNHLRLVGIGALQAGEQLDERIDIVAVDLVHFPTESAELGGKRAAGAYVFNMAVDLKAVEVYHGNEVAELLVGGEGGSLPHLAFLGFAIAHNGEHAVGKLVQLEAGSQTGGDGKALTKGSSGYLYPRAQVGIGMALKTGAQLSQGIQLVYRDVACFGQRGIERRRGMALGQDEAVSLRIGRVGRVMLQDATEIQRREDVGTGKRSTGMAAARLMEHLDDVCANGTGLFLCWQGIHGFLSIKHKFHRYNEAFQRW